MLNFSRDNRFVADGKAVRDGALDLSDKAELLRFEMDYPDTLRQYNEYKQNLMSRRGIPPGFVKLRYRCIEWFETNNFVFPRASKLEIYLGPQYTNHPWRVVDLRAFTVVMRGNPEDFLPKVERPTRVEDYRYKRMNNSRIFKFAEYTLMPGDPWKSAQDPVLLSQAEHWLKHGRKHTRFPDQNRLWVAWVLLVAILSPLVATWLIRRKGPTKMQNQHK